MTAPATAPLHPVLRKGRTLVIDSATDACSVALFENGAMLDGQFRILGRGHAEALVPMIAALPGRGKADHIAASLGPGSFTGVRVGLAAARALALAWGADLTGYASLALVAAIARETHGAMPVGVAMTGGHGEWFAQGFDADGNPSRPLQSLGPNAAAAATSEELVAGNQSEMLVAGRGHGTAMPAWPDARAFHLLPPGALITDVRPLYGRAPDARLPGDATPADTA